MNIITVIPITRGVFQRELSYFTKDKVSVGVMVQAPIKNRTVPAIVTKIETATKAKQKIRSADHSLRKIEAKGSKQILTESFIKTAQQASDFFVGGVGQVIEQYTPKILRDPASKIYQKIKISRQDEINKLPEKSILQGPYKDRVSAYKSLLREYFANQKSIYVCAPNRRLIEKYSADVAVGVEKYAVSLHSDLSKKELEESILKILEEKHPLVIFATPGFLGVPREDLGVLVLDSESSSYKQQTRPYTDSRWFAEKLAENSSWKFIIADNIIRVKTYKKYKDKKYLPLLSPQQRLKSEADVSLINMHQYDEDKDSENNFQILSPESFKLLKKVSKEKKQATILANRKGIAPNTACRDCGELVICPRCKSPLALKKRNGVRIFICGNCSYENSADVRCHACKSWRLFSYGISVDLIADIVKNNFPELNVVQIDGDSTKTHLQTKKALEKFYSKKPSVLLGTEKMVRYLDHPVDASIVASIDATLSLPDFSIQEKVFSLLGNLLEMTENNFLIQTRYDEASIFHYLKRKNMLDFYRDEMKHLKKFGYPPYTLLIKITNEGPELRVKEEMSKLKERCADWKPLLTPAFLSGSRSKFKMHLILRVDEIAWPDKDLLRILKNLPPSFRIEVEPESIL